MTFAYDGNRLRISKSVNGTTLQFLNDRDSVIAEILGTDITASYLRGINLVAMVDPQDEFEWYYHFNYHGDVTELTNASGIVVKSYKYDAFGIEENIDPNDINPFRYTAEYFDKETGTIYLRARYYDPSIGRFLNQDSYLGNPNDPLSLNQYTYAHNNPVMGVDPSGQWLETVLDVISFVDSAVTLYKEPSLVNAGMFAWDAISIIVPGVPGSYVAKTVKFASKADDLIDLGKNTKSVVSLAKKTDDIVESTKCLPTPKTQLDNNVKDYLKVSKSDLDKALEGYTQLGNNRAIYNNGTISLEVRGQRSLEHYKDNELLYHFNRKNTLSAKDIQGDVINLHHHEQNALGPIIEIPSRNHKIGNVKQHPYGNKNGISKNDRAQFNEWRPEYWKARYAKEIERRGLYVN